MIISVSQSILFIDTCTLRDHCLVYNSTLSLTPALDGVGGQRHAPATLPPVKTRYPLYRRLGGPQGRSGRM